MYVFMYCRHKPLVVAIPLYLTFLQSIINILFLSF